MSKVVKSFKVDSAAWSAFAEACQKQGRAPSAVIAAFVEKRPVATKAASADSASPPAASPAQKPAAPPKPAAAPGRTVTVAQPTPAGSTRAMAQPRANPPRTVDAATLASMPMWQRKIFGHVD